MAFRESGCTILFCSHSPYHIRHLCDVALWLKGGRVEQFGPTEPVLAAYDVHTRQRQAAEQGCDVPAVPAQAPEVATALPLAKPVAVADAGTACILSVEVANLDEPREGHPPVLQGQDLIVTITVRGRGGECPNIGFMIEQSQGVGITSLGTHEEGVSPRRMADGVWQSVLTFPDLPLHSGDYVISAYLFDATGLVVYDEWLHYLHLRFVAPKLMPGLVQLPHRWE